MDRNSLDWVCKHCNTINAAARDMCAGCQRKRTEIGELDWPELGVRILLAVITVWHLYRFFFYDSMLDWYNYIETVVRAVAGGGVVCCLMAQLKLRVDFCGRHPSCATSIALGSVWISEVFFVLFNILTSFGTMQDLFTLDIIGNVIIPLGIAAVGFAIGKFGLKLAEMPPKRPETVHKLRDPQKSVAIMLGATAVWHVIRIVLMARDYETDNAMFVCYIVAAVLCAMGVLFTLKENIEGFRGTTIWLGMLSVIIPDSAALVIPEIMPFIMPIEIPVPGISWVVVAISLAVLLYYMDELLVFYATNSPDETDEDCAY